MSAKKTAWLIVNGKEYSKFDELPPELREKIKQKMSELTAGQVGKALFRSLGPLMSGRGKEIPNNLIRELLGHEAGEELKVSFGSGSSAPEKPIDLIESSPPRQTGNRQQSISHFSGHLDQGPGLETQFEGSGRKVLFALVIAAGLFYYFRDLF